MTSVIYIFDKLNNDKLVTKIKVGSKLFCLNQKIKTITSLKRKMVLVNI